MIRFKLNSYQNTVLVSFSDKDLIENAGGTLNSTWRLPSKADIKIIKSAGRMLPTVESLIEPVNHMSMKELNEEMSKAFANNQN